MFRRSASSLLLAGLLFVDGSWLGRLEQLFRGFLGGEPAQGVWAASEIDPNGRPLQQPNSSAAPGPPPANWSAAIDPNG
jgi:hypothetical protein